MARSQVLNMLLKLTEVKFGNNEVRIGSRVVWREYYLGAMPLMRKTPCFLLYRILLKGERDSKDNRQIHHHPVHWHLIYCLVVPICELTVVDGICLLPSPQT